MTINTSEPHYKTLGAYTGAGSVPDTHPEEMRAAHERIDELKQSLVELVGIYWGDGDGIHSPPACIVRAQAALGEDVQS